MADTLDHSQSSTGPLFYVGWIAAVVVVLIALGGLVLARDVWIHRQTTALEQEEQRGPLVMVVPVSRMALQRNITYPADVHGFFESSLYPKVPGYLKTVLVDKGAKVKKGQLLAVLVSPELDQSVADAHAAYDIAAITDRRYQALISQHVISQEDADQKHAEMLTTQAKWKSLVAQQAYERVFAPFDGVVTARNLDPGALVGMSTAEQGAREIFTLATVKPVRIYVHMPQDDSAFVNDGDPARVTVSQLPGKVFTGAVTRHSNALMQSTRTMVVEVDLQNDDAILLPGMYAHVSIGVTGSSNTPLVPDDALVFRDGNTYVPVIKDDRIHLTQVELGQDDGIHCQIVQGLTGDELVAINLGQAAIEGELVRTQLADKK